MALAIDASTPAVAVNTTNTAGTTTVSFTPPANSLLVIKWSANTATGDSPGIASITDSLGTHLTYTQANWRAIPNSPTASGQAAIWTAPVTSSAAMTVTVTTGEVSTGFRNAALKITVVTDGGNLPTVGTSTKGSSLGTTTAFAFSYTATATGSWGFGVTTDWDVKGAESAGSGTTLIGSANVGTDITYGFWRRTSADGVNGSATTLNVAVPVSSTNYSWVTVEVKSASAAVNPAITFAPRRRRFGTAPRKAITAQRRVATPVPAQVNPPYAPLPALRSWRKALRPRYGHAAYPVPPQQTIPVGSFVAAAPRRDKLPRMLPALRRRAQSLDVAALTQQALPVGKRSPRRRKIPFFAGGASMASPPQLTPPRPRNAARPRRVALPTNNATMVGPISGQTTPPVNPPITQTVTRALRRWGLRRPGHSVNVVPVQQAAPTNPSITQLTSGRVRRIGVLLRRPGVAAPTAQQATTPFVQPRRAGSRFRRRPSAVAPVPVQQAAPTNPPITQYGSLWAKRWTLRRYGRVANPTPTQQTLPTNPAITALTAVRGRLSGRALRRGRVANPTPAQQAAVAAPSVTQFVTGRVRELLRVQRRGKPAAAPPRQEAPPQVLHRPAHPMAARRGHVAAPPIPQTPPPPQVVVEHRAPRLRRALRRLGFPIQGGAAPTSTAVSTIGSLGATATDLGSVSGPDGTGAGAGPLGLGGVAGADETGQTGGSGMTGSAQ